MKRFMSFISQIKMSSKQLPKQMLKLIRTDARSTTGKNLRKVLLETRKVHIDQLTPCDVLQLEYHPVKSEDEWKVEMIKELISVRNGNLEIVGFDNDEQEETLNYLCSN